jgi:formylglycine-generating enzyme required for sulfatase activity
MFMIKIFGTTTPVGCYPEGETPQGLMDMAGNVWEWMENLLSEDYTGCVLRGGSWDLYDNGLHCSARDGSPPNYRYGSVGFRVVRSLLP